MKENKIEKLILSLSTRWDCSPQEAVDRLNSMNESELNKLVNSVEKHDWGGIMGFFKSLFPMYKQERALWKNPKTRNNARTGYVKETLKTGNDSIIRMIGRPVNNPDTTMVDKNGNLYSSPHSKDPTWPTLSVEQWSKVNNKMDKAKEKSYGFKQGGLIDCLRAGGSFPKCKCGNKVEKGDKGIDSVGQKHEYYRPSRMEEIIGILSKKPKYPRQDGNGTYSAEIRHNGDTITTVTGPYTTFTETRTPKGERFIETSTKDRVTRTYAPNSSSRGFFRKPASKGIVEMFDNIRKRFK